MGVSGRRQGGLGASSLSEEEGGVSRGAQREGGVRPVKMLLCLLLRKTLERFRFIHRGRFRKGSRAGPRLPLGLAADSVE